MSILSPLLSEISKYFDLGFAKSGLFFSINFSGYITFVIIGGILAEKAGKKKIVSIALLGLSIAMVGFALSYELLFAYAAIFFVGGFSGVIESMVSAVVTDLNKENHGYYLNLTQAYLCIGAVGGPILGGLMLSRGMGWRGSYFILSAVSFLSFILMTRVKINDSIISEKLEPKKLIHTISDRKFIMICICLGFYTGTEVGVWGWMATFLKTGLGFSVEKSSAAVAVFWISMTIGRILCGRIIKIVSIRRLTAMLSYLSFLMIIFSSFVKTEIIMWIVVSATGLAFSSLYPFIVSMGSDIRSNATAFAALVGSGGIGTVIVPFLMGVIGESIGIRYAMMSPSVLMLAVGLIFTISTGNRYKDNSHQEAVIRKNTRVDE